VLAGYFQSVHNFSRAGLKASLFKDRSVHYGITSEYPRAGGASRK
jgi:hypothetical protein